MDHDIFCIGQVLRARRRELKISLEGMAAALGTSVAFVRRVESGETKLPVGKVELACEYLDMGEYADTIFFKLTHDRVNKIFREKDKKDKDL